MSENLEPLDHLETIVEFWGIDESLTKIKATLDALNELLTPTEIPDLGDND